MISIKPIGKVYGTKQARRVFRSRRELVNFYHFGRGAARYTTNPSLFSIEVINYSRVFGRAVTRTS